jgi:hypothetical protein
VNSSQRAAGTSLRREPRWTCTRAARKFTWLLFILYLAALKYGSGQASEADEQKGTIRGTVVNALTQAPIPRALVHSPDDRFAMLTDGEGHFEFALPKVKNDTQSNAGGTIYSGMGSVRSYRSSGRQFWLMARKPGFLDDSNQRTVEASPGSEVTISLMPEALIKGRVSLSTSDAAVGISVQIFSREVQEGLPRWTPGPTVRTNLAGEFRISDLRRGIYKLVTHEFMDNDPAAAVPGDPLYGFPPVYFPGVADFAAASTIDLAAGQTVEADLSLTRQPYFPVRIPVANGDISGGMNVSVQGQHGPGFSLGYNAGEQRIEGTLPNGNYVVEASTYGADSATGVVNLAVKGGPTDGPTMTLSRNGSITLEVKEEFTEANGQGSGSWSDGKRTFSVHGSRLYLHPSVVDADDYVQPRGGSIRPPTGPDDDSLVVENLKPGRYWLRLNSSRGYVASATMGGIDLLREPFTIGSGPGTPVEVKLRDDTAEIDGTVTTIADRAASLAADAPPGSWSTQAWVYLVPLPDSPGQFQQLGVSYDGKFRYQVAPGAYRVLVFATQQMDLPYRDPEGMKAYEAKGQVVHLAAEQTATVQVQIIPGSD